MCPIMAASLRNISARGGLRSSSHLSNASRRFAAPVLTSSFSTATSSSPLSSSTSTSRANNSRLSSSVPSVLSSSQRLASFSAPAQTRTMASQASKIKVKNPVVELDGDEVCLLSFVFFALEKRNARTLYIYIHWICFQCGENRCPSPVDYYCLGLQLCWKRC